MGRFLADAKHALLTEVKKLSVFVVCMLLLFAINFIPGIGSMIYAVLAPLLTLFFLVIEYMAFVLMRKQLKFSQQRRYITKRPVMMAGFACGIFCVLAIPFVQFFCIPLAVVGATLLWCDFPREEAE
jgi:CysZ protein